MAQIPYRANLQSTEFPLRFSEAGRTIIDAGADQTFVPNVNASGQLPVDRGVAQALYAHNVLPTTYGWQSIGFQEVFLAHNSGSGIEFQQAHFIQCAQIDAGVVVPQSNRTYIAIGRAGTAGVFVLSPLTRQWVPIANGQPTVFSDSRITVANINGFSYIYISRVGCFIYNAITDTLIERDLLTLEKTEVKGIVSSNGYLIAYTDKAVAWSSVINPEDFEPSDVSGAGGGNVQEAAGILVVARSNFLGFILYTRGNAVSVTYTGNENFPWTFKSIPSSGGILDPDQVSIKETGGYQYFYGTNGLQRISHVKAETLLPNITDYLSGRTLEDFDSSTNTFSYTNIPGSMRKKVAIVSDRYLVLSYGAYNDQPMTHAIVIDLLQSRYGKLKLPHNHCFEREDITNNSVEVAKESLCLLQSDGRSFVVDTGDLADISDSVLILGKYQVARQRKVQIQEVECEGVSQDDTSLEAFPSSNGYDLGLPVAPYAEPSTTAISRYLFDALVGQNICLMFKGKFNLTSLIIWFTLHGRY